MLPVRSYILVLCETCRFSKFSIDGMGVNNAHTITPPITKKKRPATAATVRRIHSGTRLNKRRGRRNLRDSLIGVYSNVFCALRRPRTRRERQYGAGRSVNEQDE